MEKYYLQVYGCQMNQYEAEIVRTVLNRAGFRETGYESDAEILLMITCAVREHAEQRALGKLATFKSYKKNSPRKLIGVLGCIAQNMKERLITEYGVDIVAGPDEYRRLPELVMNRHKDTMPQLAVRLGGECYSDIHPIPNCGVTGKVMIMRGCSNFCSYCIVPFVRGPERSRPVESIVNEINQLAQKGIKDITLLGQNVLAYKYNGTDFADLLGLVSEIEGIERIRFLTSHPRDLNQITINRLGTLPKVCPQLHLPLQSGSNRILQLMNRGYTREEYLQKVAEVRRTIPDISLTTDIIVGFPTETENDYALTLDLVQQIRFDFAYMFKFSPRPGTRAADIIPRVPESQAEARLSRLIKIQNQITLETNQNMIGKKYELLIEGKSPRHRGALGRTRAGKVVIVDEEIPPGNFIEVVIKEIRGWTPVGIRNGG